MEAQPKHYALYWWLGMAATVAAWDAIRQEDTLTSCYRRGMENPLARPFLTAAAAATALHLCNVIPRKYDVYYVIPDYLNKLRFSDNPSP